MVLKVLETKIQISMEKKKSRNCLLESCQLHQKFAVTISKIHFIYRVFLGVCLLVFIFGKNPAFPPTSRLLDSLINLDLTNNRNLKNTQFRKYENSHIVGMNGLSCYYYEILGRTG